jgi:hypothetical protein
MKYREVARSIEEKLPGGVPRTGKERTCWAVLDGSRVLRVTCPCVHGRNTARNETTSSGSSPAS